MLQQLRTQPAAHWLAGLLGAAITCMCFPASVYPRVYPSILLLPCSCLFSQLLLGFVFPVSLQELAIGASWHASGLGAAHVPAPTFVCWRTPFPHACNAKLQALPLPQRWVNPSSHSLPPPQTLYIWCTELRLRRAFLQQHSSQGTNGRVRTRISQWPGLGCCCERCVHHMQPLPRAVQAPVQALNVVSRLSMLLPVAVPRASMLAAHVQRAAPGPPLAPASASAAPLYPFRGAGAAGGRSARAGAHPGGICHVCSASCGLHVVARGGARVTPADPRSPVLVTPTRLR